MTESADSIGWRRLREFSDVDFAQSYVLSWSAEDDTLKIDVDLCLEEKHPFYEKPRPREKICIRPAVIEFPYCESLSVNGRVGHAPLADLAAGLDLGAIHNMRRLDDGPFEISGEFGSVLIDSERPILRFHKR